jgi:hypothetical protein
LPKRRDAKQESKDPVLSGAQTLIHAIARAHAWLRLLADGSYDSIERLAESVEPTPKAIRNTIGLAARILRSGPNATPANQLAASVGFHWS